jgi:hypothetical protein
MRQKAINCLSIIFPSFTCFNYVPITPNMVS